MHQNHLEKLVAEWYEYKGFFLRKNVYVDPKPKGGYAGELDIIGVHPSEKRLIHVECSLDADAWEKREERFLKKFNLGSKHIPLLFRDFNVSSEIEKYAVLLFASRKNHPTIGGGKVLTVETLLKEIINDIRLKKIEKNAVPENFELLRTVQYICQYRATVF